MLLKDDDIAGIFVNFYKNMLGNEFIKIKYGNLRIFEMGYKLNIDEQLQFFKFMLMLGIKDVFFVKVFGFDGCGRGFFKFFWFIIGDDITRVIKEFFLLW